MLAVLSLPMPMQPQHNASSPTGCGLSRLASGLCICCAVTGFALSLGLSACKQPAGGTDFSTLAPIMRGGSAGAGPRGARCSVPNAAAAPAPGARATRTGKRRAIIV